MPAQRPRGSRRGGAAGKELVWTMPVESASSGGFDFATNAMSITFDAPITDKDSLFPHVVDSSPRRPNHSKKKPDNHIPRPPNAFILFRSSFIKSQHVSTEVETNHSTLSKIIGLTWQNLPEDERQIWHAKAKQALDDHKRKFPQYAFRPLHPRGKSGAEKRKVREVGVKDIKRCEKIAELLVEGKKGTELDAAIQEFDKHHVPAVVTRFEAPITEESFRGSQSSSNYVVEDDDDDEDEDVSRREPSTPSRSRSTSRKPAASLFNNPLESADSLGPPPPLVDPFDYPDACQEGEAVGTVNDPYLFAPDPSYIISTFTLDDSAAPNLPTETLASFTDNSFSSGNPDVPRYSRKPSLSIDTSTVTSVPSHIAQPWTYQQSPASGSTDSLNGFPVTPGYPETPEYPYDSYNPYISFTGHYTPQLSHSPSLSASSSYEDLSSMYQNDGLTEQCVPPSPVCNYQDGNAPYTDEFSIFVHGQDTAGTEFIETYGSSVTSPLFSRVDEDFEISKAKVSTQSLFEPSILDLDFASRGIAGTIPAY